MSKVLSKEEAEKIIRMMLEPMGFKVPVLIEDSTVDSNVQHRACYANTITKKTGHLWWKKTSQTTEHSLVWGGWCWEEVLEKADKWVQTRAKPRVELAEKLRDRFAMQEANEALDKELQK